jgi:hypothetical protein
MTSNRTSAIIIGVLLLAAAALVLFTLQPRPQQDKREILQTSPSSASPSTKAAGIQGFWEGTLQVQGAKLRLVLKVADAPGGGYTATLDSVDQGAKDIPVNSITLSNATLRAELKTLGVLYEGELTPNKNEFDGEWNQAGLVFPLVLRRTKEPSTVIAPKPAAAYARSPEAPLQGWWQGALNIGDSSLRLLFKVSKTASGKYEGTLDSLDQGANNISATSVEFTKPDVRIGLASVNGNFTGIMTADELSIDGQWSQGGNSLPLQLQRTEAKDETPPENVYAVTSETDVPGVWRGTLDIRGTKLRLVLKIAKTTNGYRAFLDSVDQGAKDIAATSVKFKDADLEVEWKGINAFYHGQLEKGKLTGFWQQGPAEFPLDLERAKK